MEAIKTKEERKSKMKKSNHTTLGKNSDNSYFQCIQNNQRKFQSFLELYLNLKTLQLNLFPAKEITKNQDLSISFVCSPNCLEN